MNQILALGKKSQGTDKKSRIQKTAHGAGSVPKIEEIPLWLNDFASTLRDKLQTYIFKQNSL